MAHLNENKTINTKTMDETELEKMESEQSKLTLENALWSIKGLIDQSEQLEIKLKKNIYEILSLSVKHLNNIK